MRSAYTQCWISSDKRGVETENKLSVSAYKPGTVKSSDIYFRNKLQSTIWTILD